MSDGSLSQEEIDALLSGTGGLDFASSGSGSGGDSSGAAGAGAFSDAEKKALQSFLNSTVSAQGSNLSGVMATKTVTFKNPKLEIVSRDDLIRSLPEEVIEVKINYSGAVSGSHSYIVDTDSAGNMASIIVGQEEVELGEMALEALKEAFGTITGVFLTSLGDKIGNTIMPTPGESSMVSRDQISVTDDSVVKVSYPVSIEGDGQFDLIELFEMSMARDIVSQLAPAASAGGGKQNVQAGGRKSVQPQNTGFGGQPQMGGNQGMMGGLMGFGMGGGQPGPNVQPVQFPNLIQSGGGSSDMGNISLLMDVYMEMTVELGRTKKPIREILGMGEGTIIELDKLAGEPVDILVNHKLIATGEVVVIDENFGVRVTEIVSPNERIKDL